MHLPFRAIIFDLDSVLVDSAEVVENYWQQWAIKHQLDPERVIKTAHGRRTVDTITELLPHANAQKEAKKIAREEGTQTNGLKIIEGAKQLLESLPEDSWAVATSGTKSTALTRLNFAGLPIPKVLITAEDVDAGKPDPQVYTLAAKRLKVDSSKCIVVEDTPAGIEAARRAGMIPVAVTTTHPKKELGGAEAIVPSISELRVEIKEGLNLIMPN